MGVQVIGDILVSGLASQFYTISVVWWYHNILSCWNNRFLVRFSQSWSCDTLHISPVRTWKEYPENVPSKTPNFPISWPIPTNHVCFVYCTRSTSDLKLNIQNWTWTELILDLSIPFQAASSSLNLNLLTRRWSPCLQKTRSHENSEQSSRLTWKATPS